MRITVFGATGTVGTHVVEQAVRRGHEVTAVTRDAQRVRTAGVRVVESGLGDRAALRAAVAGQDAVVVVLGAGRKGGVRAAGTAAVIEAMRAEGVTRLVVQSTLGVGDSRGNLNFVWKRLMFGLLLRPAYADHVAQEEQVRASGLDWTVVRPAAFTDGPLTGEYRAGFGPEVRSSLKVSRADVAHFVLDQLADDTYRHDTPALAY